MASSSSSDKGRLRWSISCSHLKACSCSGVICNICEGLGVAMPMALDPMGVDIEGVIMAEGVPAGVIIEGVPIDGVAFPPCEGVGVAPPGVAEGVSSHLDLLLLAPGVGVSLMIFSPPPWRSVRGVSAHPAPCPGVSRSVRGVSSHLQCKLTILLY